MLSTKIRTSIIALAAVASISGTAIAPAVSHAEALTPKQAGEQCDGFQFYYGQEMDRGAKAFAEGSYSSAYAAWARAGNWKASAREYGCAWAFSGVAPAPEKTPVAVSPSRLGTSVSAKA